MIETTSIPLASPRFQERDTILIAGLKEHFTVKTLDGIPRLWQRIAPYIGSIRGQIGKADYGVCLSAANCQDGFDYIAGVEVTDFQSLPQDWTRLQIPPTRFAFFAHQGHVSTIRNTVHAIFNQWLPASRYQHASDSPNRPELLERYSEEFNPQTGTGGMEIWIPIKDSQK